MKKFFVIPICFLVAICFIGCQSETTMIEMITDEIGIEIGTGEEIINYSSEETFLGDGEVLYGFQFSNQDVENQIKNNSRWKQLPVNSTLDAILKKSDYEVYIPEITNGYYFFMDRHREAIDCYDESEVLNRNSRNYTMAIYDSDTATLYYIRYDS